MARTEVQLTALGHAGLRLDSPSLRLVMDPWFSRKGAFQASWFQFPSNDHLDVQAVLDCDWIALSHQHLDHMDFSALAQRSPRVRVAIPKYASSQLRQRLERGGLHNVVEVAAWIEAVNTLKYNAVYASTGSFAQLRSPSILFTSGPVWGPLMNNTGYHNDRYTDLVNQAGLEVDPAKKKQIFAQLNDMLLDQTFVTPLAPNPPRVALRGTVKGVTYSAHEGFVYTGAWLDKASA